MRVIFVSIFIVLIDQITKLIVKGFSIPFLNIKIPGMYQGQKIQVIDNFFRITFIENPGMAFGYDPGSKFKLWLSLFSLFASIALIIYLFIVRKKNLSLRLSLAFILGGAVGNLIDRMFYGVAYGYAPLFYGKVVDFFDFDFFHFTILGRTFDRFPIFNIADASVTIGVIILILFYKKHSDILLADESSSSTESESDFATENKEQVNNTAIVPEPNTLVEDDKTDKGKDISL